MLVSLVDLQSGLSNGLTVGVKTTLSNLFQEFQVIMNARALFKMYNYANITTQKSKQQYYI